MSFGTTAKSVVLILKLSVIDLVSCADDVAINFITGVVSIVSDVDRVVGISVVDALSVGGAVVTSNNVVSLGGAVVSCTGVVVLTVAG